MKKIAILTQPLKGNYGGIIQNYALQEVLRGGGFEVETIAREYGRDATATRRFLAHLKNDTYNWVVGKRKKIFSKKEAEFIFAENTRFIQERIGLSPKLYDTAGLAQYFKNRDFDAVIVGSDQTWRPKYSPAIGNYFLDFLVDNSRIYKMAYAASFGTDEWEFTEREREECSTLIEHFDAVSVREKSAVSLCQQFLNVEAEWVLDPTLLLTQADYRKLYSHKDGHKKGVFTYILDTDVKKRELVEKVANKLNVSVYTHQPHRPIEGGNVYDFDNLDDFKYPAPEGWLQSFDDADFVLTDSFHGTVFAILFNKPFYAIVNDARGAARFHSLLQMFDLEHRLITCIDTFKLNTGKLDINYQHVNEKLTQWRGKCAVFLQQNLANLLNDHKAYEKFSV
ncbi:polysaccharide pyruvyl transferase family protein [Sphingobacterium sp. SYP-B4668]|uniref:polysaccharide pyruvyl transferase family protein n=1 Tax=Sphingobacterium sp. SYP-B4668 TaxID=2996035 RepID=UPI0022DD6187|nr:polysaccharide pyruvyl transferase family protein [Sphingobacterium sp. SYP-B4668]